MRVFPGNFTNIYQEIDSQVVPVVKNPPANAGDRRDAISIPGLRRSPGGRHDNPLQYSCLENPMVGGGWRLTIHGIAKSQTWLKWLSMHAPGNRLLSFLQNCQIPFLLLYGDNSPDDKANMEENSVLNRVRALKQNQSSVPALSFYP